MGNWKERKSTSDLTVLGDDEGHVRNVGGLLTAVRQDTMYPSRSNYELTQRNGDVLWLAGSASLSRQLGPVDVGHFIKASFEGWGQSPNGKFKNIHVSVYEGEPTPVMLAWPGYAEMHAKPKKAATPLTVVPSVDDDFSDDDGLDMPF